MDSDTTATLAPAPALPTTRWTGLLEIRKKGLERSREELQELFVRYWPVVHRTIAKGWVRDPEQAADLAQDFFLSLLERDFSRDLSPEKGRFRHFIKAALRNFLLNWRRDGRRLKRGGAAAVVPLEGQDPAAEEGPFDSEWRDLLMQSSLEELRATCEATGRRVRFEVFRLHYGQGGAGAPMSYPEISAALSISVFDAGNHVKWARSELRRIILERIRQYEGDDAGARRELRDLFGA